MPDPLVIIEAGDLPIILSAPHGGRRPVPGVVPRKGEDVPQFVARSDSWTDELTEKLADEIEKNTGKRPYVVIAKFHRKFIDANRPPERAYESKAAKETYDTYHKALADARAKVIARWGTGILNFSSQYLPSEKSADAINVGVYLDKGAGKSKINLLHALSTFDEVSIQHLTAKDIQSGKLDQLDVLIQPGGSGGGQGRHLGEDGREKIRHFLKNGGGYIGICAGAYLASADYSWSLNILDAKVIDRKHWARGNGTVKLTLSDSGKNLLQAPNNSLEIFYAQGPLLAPANNPNIPDYDPVATFQTEIAKKGAPKGVMIGTTAIAEGRFGEGRVICFSPHPELTKGLDHSIQFAIHKVSQGRSNKVK